MSPWPSIWTSKFLSTATAVYIMWSLAGICTFRAAEILSLGHPRRVEFVKFQSKSRPKTTSPSGKSSFCLLWWFLWICNTFRPSKKNLSGVVCNAVIVWNWGRVRNPFVFALSFNSSPELNVLSIAQCSSLTSAKHIFSCHVLLWMSSAGPCGSRPISQMFRRGRGDGRWRKNELPDQLHDAEVSQWEKGWSVFDSVYIHSSLTKLHQRL